jgi:hypothetical protein
MEIILTILLCEIKGKIWKLYWQYYSERSKEKYGNYTDNITLWDQRKNMEIILTILLCEIKGKIWKLYWQYYSVRSKEKYGNYIDNITLWDQRKSMEIILTILLCEIKGKIWKLPLVLLPFLISYQIFSYYICI